MNRNTACSPTRAREPSLKRNSAKEERPVDKASPGFIASDTRAGRAVRLLGIRRTRLRIFWTTARFKAVSALTSF